MARLETRDLQLLAALDGGESVAAVAARLGVTASAVRHRIATMERRLGRPLRARAAGDLAPTEAGLRAARRARALLAAICDAELAARRTARPQARVLRLSTLCFTAYEWLVPALERLRERHPELGLSLVADLDGEPLAALAARRADLAIVHDPLPPAPYGCVALGTARDVALAAVGHRWGERPHVTARDFDDEVLLRHRPLPGRSLRQDYLVPFALSPRRIEIVAFTDVLLAMVRRGLGVAIVPEWLVPSGAGLVAYPIGVAGVVRRWYLAQRAGLTDDPAVTDLADALRAALATRASRGGPRA